MRRVRAAIDFYRGRDGYWWLRCTVGTALLVLGVLCWLNLVGLIT